MNYFCRCEIIHRKYSYFIRLILNKILFVLFIQVFNNINLIHFDWRQIFISGWPSWKIFNNVWFQNLSILILRVHIDFRFREFLLGIFYYKTIDNILLIQTFSVIWWFWALCIYRMTSHLMNLFAHYFILNLWSACIQFYIFFN